MTDQEITQEQFNELISDAEYLLDEAEALKYVSGALRRNSTSIHVKTD